LIALSAVPLTAGTLRLVQLAGGPQVFPADHRFVGFPVALVAHIVGAAVFAVVGAFQLAKRIRRRHRAWHRRAGRVVAVAGLVVSGSALWLTLGYPAQPGTGELLFVLRLVLAPAMAACVVLGFTAVRRRDIAAHRAWMIRAYAIGLGAGTQVLTQGVGEALFGTGELRGDLAKAAGWAVNLAVAEWVIRRPARRRHAGNRPATASTGAAS
jgi:cytochrome bd-type quinol oxidase subunit 2